MLAFSPLSCCSLWSSPHHLPDTQHDTPPNKVSSPTWFVSHLVQCENTHLRFAFQNNKIDPVTLLTVKTSTNSLLLTGQRAIHSWCLNLFDIWPHTHVILPGTVLPTHVPISSDLLLYPQYLWLSHCIFFSRSSQPEAILFSVETTLQ